MGGGRRRREERRGSSICTVAARQVVFWRFSARPDTGILNMTEPTLHAAHKEHTHTHTLTALQTATCTPCMDPAGLSASLWAQILLNRWLIPSCMSCIPSTKPPSFQPFLLFPLFPFFIYVHYFPPPPLSSWPPSLPPSPPPLTRSSPAQITALLTGLVDLHCR